MTAANCHPPNKRGRYRETVDGDGGRDRKRDVAEWLMRSIVRFAKQSI